MDERPKFLDLFCGIGGLSLGLERAGFAPIGGVDSWEDAARTFEHNHTPQRCLVGDVSKLQLADIVNYFDVEARDIDVMVGGPPCQGFSTVGKRDAGDPRNKLWEHYLELVSQIRPAYVLIENVEGLVVMDRGHVCDRIVESFGRIGYRANGNCYGQPTTASRSFENALSSLRRSTHSPSPTFQRPRFQGRGVRRPSNQAPISRRTTEAISTRATASLCTDASINSRPRKGPRRVAEGASPPSNLHRPPVGRANQSP